MSIGYGTSKTPLLPVGTDEPTATINNDAALEEVQDTLAQDVTEVGVNFSAVPEPGHGTRTHVFGPRDFANAGGTGTGPSFAALYWVSTNALILEGEVWDLPVGERLNEVRARCRPNGVGATWTMSVYRVTINGGTATLLGSVTSTTGAADEEIAITGLAHTILSENYILIRVTQASAAGSPRFYGARTLSDRP